MNIIKYSSILNFNMQCGQVIKARQPYIMLIHEEEKEVRILDAAIPGGLKVKYKETTKLRNTSHCGMR